MSSPSAPNPPDEEPARGYVGFDWLEEAVTAEGLVPIQVFSHHGEQGHHLPTFCGNLLLAPGDLALLKTTISGSPYHRFGRANKHRAGEMPKQA